MIQSVALVLLLVVRSLLKLVVLARRRGGAPLSGGMAPIWYICNEDGTCVTIATVTGRSFECRLVQTNNDIPQISLVVLAWQWIELNGSKRMVW